MKIKTLFILLITTPLLASSQSIRNGVNESYFNTIKASEFDFAGIWQGNRFEVVYDSILQEVVQFEFMDSITDIVFVRHTANEEILYEVIPLNARDTAVLGKIMILKDADKLQAYSQMDSEVKYEHFSDAVIYGIDALQLNIDVPESDYFFGKEYKATEDLNVFWEFLRYYPNQQQHGKK